MLERRGGGKKGEKGNPRRGDSFGTYRHGSITISADLCHRLQKTKTQQGEKSATLWTAWVLAAGEARRDSGRGRAMNRWDDPGEEAATTRDLYEVRCSPHLPNPRILPTFNFWRQTRETLVCAGPRKRAVMLNYSSSSSETDKQADKHTQICRRLRPSSCQVLGVAKDATESQIKKAYHKLAMIHHPDKRAQNASGSDQVMRLLCPPLSHAHQQLPSLHHSASGVPKCLMNDVSLNLGVQGDWVCLQDLVGWRQEGTVRHGRYRAGGNR